MGIQDRDWYWKDREEKERAAAASRPAAATRPRHDPDALISRANREQPPKLWGSDWHWSIQVLVWLCIAVLLLSIWRLVR